MLDAQRAPIARERAENPLPAAPTRWTVFEGTHALHPAVIPALLLLAGLAATGVLISGSGLLPGSRRRPGSLAPAPPTAPAAPPARPRPGDRIPRDVAAVLASIERGAAGRTPHPRGVRS